MKKISIILPLILCIVFIGCGKTQETKAITNNPKTYNNSGVSLEYPKNWKITEDVKSNKFRYLFIETEGDAITVIQVFPIADALTLKQFSKEFSISVSQGLKEGIPLGTDYSKFSNVTSLNGVESMTEKFSISILGIKVPHERIYKRISQGKDISFFIFQVAVEDKKKATKGFQILFSSFKYIKSEQRAP